MYFRVRSIAICKDSEEQQEAVLQQIAYGKCEVLWQVEVLQQELVDASRTAVDLIFVFFEFGREHLSNLTRASKFNSR